MKRPWTGIVSDEEEQRYKAAGFGGSSGIGTRPALLVIDAQYRTIGLEERPFWASIEEFKTSCGDSGWEAVRHIRPLLEKFRAKKLPIFFPHVTPNEVFDHGRPAGKSGELVTVAIEGYRFIEELAPEYGEVLLPKKYPSAFFGTPLASYLIDSGADSLVVAGCTTSGGVRASVVDAFAYNFKVTVPEECSYDRSPVSHAVNLFDMAYKYADVRPLADVLAAIDAIGAPSAVDAISRAA